MSKKEIDFNKLDKTTNHKDEEKVDTEEAIALIHNELASNEKTKRVTIDLPFSLYVDIKTKIVLEEMTLKDYIIALAKRDLNS